MNEKKLFNIPFTILVIFVSVIGAIIGMQLITTIGITPNTSIIGALFAIVLSKVPLAIFNNLKSLHAQNVIQTTISGATFAAANSLMVPIAIPYVMGRPDLMMPMLIGVSIALFIDGLIIYKIFDSKIFPASNPWPPGVASAETIKAGDSGGKYAGFLGLGIIAGAGGTWFGIPMAVAGIAFIANMIAMVAFSVGLIISGYSISIFGVDINDLYIPHGIMVGAGLVALAQFVGVMLRDRENNNDSDEKKEKDIEEDSISTTRSSKEVLNALGLGYIAFVVGAIILSLLAGLITELSIGMLILFVLYAAFTAMATELVTGVAAMHSGYFPIFALSLVSLFFGMLIGFPPLALALLVGYISATGPAFADLGYDLKSGFILRGNNKNIAYELFGRRQQFKASLIGFLIAVIFVYLFHSNYFELDLIPPYPPVYVSTIEAGISSEVAKQIFLWAIPGALIQLIGGSRRQLGVLLATGLLIANPILGLTVIVGLVIRVILLQWKGEVIEKPMYTVAAGFIAGGALQDFFGSIIKAR